MPFKPSVTAGIESPLNTFLYRSPTLKTVRLRLLGEVLRVRVKGFSMSLILVFSERQAGVPGEWAGDADRAVIAYASMLPRLHDRQRLTVPIRSGELGVQGDIQMVQNFVTLANLAELDPAELPAPYADGIAAEGVSKAMRGSVKFLHHGIKRQQCYAAETITEEWRMVPDPFEVAWFAEGTAVVECVVDALTRRLEKLEAK